MAPGAAGPGSADQSNWYGFRFELNIAATLALKDVVFVSNEDRATVPDFTVPLPGGDIGVECTSTRLTSRRDDPVAWKIGAASNSKAAKPYAQRYRVVWSRNYTHYSNEMILCELISDPIVNSVPDSRPSTMGSWTAGRKRTTSRTP